MAPTKLNKIEEALAELTQAVRENTEMLKSLSMSQAREMEVVDKLLASHDFSAIFGLGEDDESSEDRDEGGDDEDEDGDEDDGDRGGV